MSATDPHKERRARLPTDYIGGTCEGRQASPSNPTGAGKARTKEPLFEWIIFVAEIAFFGLGPIGDPMKRHIQ
ncbi:hypothetical protein SAMN04488036_10813 [Shimia haliotis]|uniref:Uncharacterized protein n=1 Tax=Shimia haliotis TaxID=1280847 RepID=A0A1I4G9Y3_9RHOB|nr:hypothetical protein SAMN04488036_10813 [Shimia haliotis]